MEIARDSLDQEACYRAVRTRDPRFDGRFFTCVKTTGIYCRPVCPARTPKRENMRFVASAAAAEEAGFRACLRCRPETAPDLYSWRGSEPRGGAWRGTSNTVSRALGLIEAGALDEGDVDGLAARLGVGERHLRRLFRQHLGAAPVSVAQTRRVLLAKALIHQTDLAMAEVALASGFGSVRRFNETFQSLYGRPPSALRRRAEKAGDGGVRLSLPYRPPYEIAAMLAALTVGGETVEDGVWRRALTLDVDGATGEVSARFESGNRLAVTVAASDLKALPGILARVRRVFDLSADPEAIQRDLSADLLLAPLVRARPGLRLPGDWIDISPNGAADMASDRLADTRLAARAEQWRPWRAYGALHLREAGIDSVRIMESDDEKDAA